MTAALGQWSGSGTGSNAADSARCCTSRELLGCLRLWSCALLSFYAPFAAAGFAGFLPVCFLCSLQAAIVTSCFARLTWTLQEAHYSEGSSWRFLSAEAS